MLDINKALLYIDAMCEQNLNPIQLASAKAGSQKALASFLGVSPAYINQLYISGKPLAARHCKKVTDRFGISLKVLRPNDWLEFWPELQEESQCDS